MSRVCVCVCLCVCLCVHPGSFNMQQGNRVRGVTSACLCAPVPSAPRLLFLPPRTHLANRSLACQGIDTSETKRLRMIGGERLRLIICVSDHLSLRLPSKGDLALRDSVGDRNDDDLGWLAATPDVICWLLRSLMCISMSSTRRA